MGALGIEVLGCLKGRDSARVRVYGHDNDLDFHL